MKIQPYVHKLESSEAFKKFRKDYAESFLVAGFFILDYESGTNLHQIDYYVPSKKQVAAFNLDGEVEVKLLDMMSKEKVPERLDLRTKVDLDAIKGILEDEMKNRSITESIKKCVAVLQVINGKKLWVLNCVLSGMEILKAHIDDDSRTVLKMERASMMDYIKKMPGQVPGQAPQGQPKMSKEQLQKQIEQLDKLKEQLKKEQSQLDESANKN